MSKYSAEKLAASIEMKSALEKLVKELSPLAFKNCAPIAQLIIDLGHDIEEYRSDCVGNYKGPIK